MATLSRALRRWEPARVAAVALGLSLVLLVAAYGVAVAVSTLATGPALGAAALVGIAGIGLLYAWRPETGTVD